MAELDFDAFGVLLQKGNINAAKNFVTPENAKARENGYGVLWHVCFFGDTDDPSLLYHFVNLGSTLELDSAGKRSSPLHHTAGLGNRRQLRALLDLGIPVNIINNKDTPLCWSLTNNQVKCTRLLLDAGAQLKLAKENEFNTIPQWVHEFVTKREETRISSVIILGLLLCKSKVTGQNGKDVLKIMARCTWSLRGLKNTE